MGLGRMHLLVMRAGRCHCKATQEVVGTNKIT